MANLAFARAFNLRAPKLLSKIFAHARIRAKIDILDIEDMKFLWVPKKMRRLSQATSFQTN